MEKLLNEEITKQIKEMFSVMKEEVNLVLFTEKDSESSKITEQLIKEIEPLSEMLAVNIYSLNEEQEAKEKYQISEAPALLVFNAKTEARGVFYGIPAGHEINTLLTTIVDASNYAQLYEENVIKEIKTISQPTNIKVFVTTACPHCPGAAINALRLAQLNNNIKAEVYEVHTYGDIGQKYHVSGVPKIVIDETKELMGNQPIEAFLEKISN